MERELQPGLIQQVNACKGPGEQGYVCSNTTLVNSTSNVLASSSCSIYTQTLHPARILAPHSCIPFPFDLYFPAHWQTRLY